MAKDLSYYQALVAEMLVNDDKRDRMYEGIDEMYWNQWELPREVRDLQWMRKVVSTDPHDALNTAIRVLSTVKPRITVQPLAPGPVNQEQADLVERALFWHLMNASRRPKARPVRDIVASALRYDEVAVQVVYVPWQMEILGIKKDSPRGRAMSRMGPFSLVVHNPRTVHARYSDYMLEGVALTKVMRAHEVINFWGKRADKLAREMELEDKPERGDEFVSVFDYTDHESRVIWAVRSGSGRSLAGAEDEDKFELLREDHDLPFIPWVARVGGTAMELEPEYQRKPLLEPVWRTGSWETQNVVESIGTSEAIAYAASPRFAIIGPAGEMVEVMYGEPNRPILAPPGHTIQPLNPPGVDAGLLQVLDRQTAKVQKATMAKQLANLDFPSGTAFATVNAVMQAATAALQPYKELAEFSLADICAQMLEWVDYTGDALIAYSGRTDDVGTQLVVQKGDYDVNNLYLTVELEADVPTDRMQRINAATLLHERLKVPLRRVLQDLGITDADQAIDEWRQAQLDDNELQIAMQQDQALSQMELQQALQAAQQPQQQGVPSPNGAGAAFDQVGGPGFNPNAGGISPLEAAPGLGREQVTGVDRAGEELQV